MLPCNELNRQKYVFSPNELYRHITMHGKTCTYYFIDVLSCNELYYTYIYTLLYINIILYNCKICIITLRIYRKKLYRPTHRLGFRHNLATHHRLRNERRSRVWDARGRQLSLVHQTCSRSFLRVAPWKSRWFATTPR